MDKVICFWDTDSFKLINKREGLTGDPRGISFSFDGRLFASKSYDDKIRIWRTDIYEIVATFYELKEGWNWSNIHFHPSLPILATLGESDTVIRIWELDIDALLGQKSTESIRYTTAKLVLCGDSGVGKTGLGWRLAHGEFKEHASTHGQQFWVIDELKKTRKDGTECEAVLWDLAGQPIYGHVHPLFLNNVDLSLLTIDPTKGMESLQGIEFWINQLSGKDKLPPSVLVGARVDRGDSTLTEDELTQFCRRHGIEGGYIRTSAKDGIGLDKLMEILKSHIPWDEMTTTVTTVTFKRIKEFVLSLKERPERENILVNPAELRTQLESTDPDWQFTDDEMMTAVGHLENHGYVTILRTSDGQKSILLSPDLLVNLVSSIVIQASRHPRNLGALSETALLSGDYSFEELKGLSKSEREILSDAAVLRFLEHNICFREILGADNLLIFPALIQRKRPIFDDFETVEDVSYIARGAVENVYAALVVLLGYTHTFTRVNQWQNQAQYEMGAGEICGFRQIEERAGEIELILYYASTTPEYARTMFQGLFEKFLNQRDVDVTRYPPLYCVKEHLQERATVIKRLREGRDFLFCPECGNKVALPKVAEPLALGERDRRKVDRAEHLAQLRRTYEIHLSRVKGYRRDRTAPRCFISHLPVNAPRVAGLSSDLREAGVYVVDDMKQVKSDDFILLATTSDYKRAWESRDTLISGDIDIVQSRLRHPDKQHSTVVPVLLEGDRSGCLPEETSGIRLGDFRNDTRYVLELFDLVLTLYAIPFNRPAFKPLRKDLLRQWENTLGRMGEFKREVFISYAWGGESEEIADALERAFKEKGVVIRRDKRDVGFKGSIGAFMDELGEGKSVVLVISEKYLKSANCCYELVRISNRGAFKDRIFPIVLTDAKIYDPAERLRYVQHWKGRKTNWTK